MNCLPLTCSCDTLLGHLARNKIKLTEDAATHALAYIVNRAPGAARALSDLCAAAGVPLPAPIRNLDVHAPTKGKKAYPDLLAISAAGQPLGFLEVKFNAALTEQQQNGYRTSLKPEGPNATLFLVPKDRRSYVASHLNPNLVKNPNPQNKWTYHIPQQNVHISILSWEQLLNAMAQAHSPALDQRQQYELQQLRELTKILSKQKLFIPLSNPPKKASTKPPNPAAPRQISLIP